MPVYEYQCEQCGVRFERLQPMSADPVDSCPECGSQAHRVIFASWRHFQRIWLLRYRQPQIELHFESKRSQRFRLVYRRQWQQE